jgi:hypothetical protein
MLTLPLEKAKKYRTNWNFMLVGYQTRTIPEWWYTTKSLAIPETEQSLYRWVASTQELNSLNGGESADGVWKLVKDKQKPGYEGYDYPIYELTESSKHSSKKAAGWAIAKKAGKISDPDNGDFGIKSKLGGDWLCEGGQISFDGKYWIASCTFAHSPDGWDQDIYKED